MHTNKLNHPEMISPGSDTSRRQAAIVTGIALIIMAIAAGFAVGFVFESLVVPNDANATAENIKASELLFRGGVLSWLIILICDVLVAWGLYVFLKPVNASLSLLTGWLRLMYTAILGTALFNLVMVLLLLNRPDYLTTFETVELNALILLSLNGFNQTWSLGLIVFGLHLLGLGYLVYASGYIPKILGVLIILAACGYVITNVGNMLLPNYEAYKTTLEMIFMAPMILGEVGLAIWLLFWREDHATKRQLTTNRLNA